MNKSFNDSANQTIEVFTKLLDVIQKSNGIAKDIKIGLRDTNDQLNFKGLDAFEKINDIASLIAVSTLDLAVTGKFLYNASNKWEEIYCTKNAYLTIFETFKTYSKYRKLLHEISMKSDVVLIKEFKYINNLIKAFKNKHSYDNKMSVIRNNISGHISDNRELYYNTIIQFDSDETMEMIGEFLEITYYLKELLNELLRQEILKKNNRELIKLAIKIIPDLNDKIKSLQ